MSTEQTMRTRLRSTGLTTRAIDAAWPAWWSEEAESSESAVAELKFSLARQLGLSATSLLADSEPTFLWSDETRFKNLGSVTAHEAAVLASFSISVARSAIHATDDARRGLPVSPAALRTAILSSAGSVGLRELVTACWALGIPVLQLEVFPLQQKRMHAVSARVDDRHAILVGHKTNFPSQAAFWLAHELGHIALGHVHDAAALMDVEDPLTSGVKDDDEEAADRYALELLTGTSDPQMQVEGGGYVASQLAAAASAAASVYGVDPGVLALCLAYRDGTWHEAFGALKILGEINVGEALNDLALRSMAIDRLPADASGFLLTVLGADDV